MSKGNGNGLLSGLIGGVLSAGSSLINNLINQHNYKKNLKLSAETNKEYQSWLLNNSAPMQMRALKAAGINPALAESNGVGNASMPSISASGTSPMATDFSPISSLMSASAQVKQANQNIQTSKSQEDLNKADARLKNADAESKERENKINKGSDTILKNLSSPYIKTKDGNELRGDEALKYVEDHPDEANNLSVEGTSPEWIQAESKKQEYYDLKAMVNRNLSQYETERLEHKARRSAARFEDYMNNRKLKDSDMQQAILDLPKEQVELLRQQVQHENALIIWQKLNNKRFEESDFGRLLDKMFSKDMSFGDKLLAVLTFLANGSLRFFGAQ